MERVSIVRVDREDVHSAVRQAVDLVGGIRRYVRPGSSVMIKPNLVSDLHWSTGATTNPDVIRALVLLAREAGADRIIVADGPAVGCDAQKVFRATGYDELAKELDVELIDLNTAPKELVQVPRGLALKTVHVASIALEVDVVINVPVIKTHSQTMLTLAVKNMKGVLAPEGKRKDHFVGLDQAVADMSTVLKQTLVVVDGMIGQEKYGPIIGDPVRLDLIMAGENAVAVDAVASRVVGFDPEKIDHLVFAARHGLGPLSEAEIEVVGETITSVAHPFVPVPTDMGAEFPGVNVVEKTTCSGCWSSLTSTLERMRRGEDLESVVAGLGGELNIVMGRDGNSPEDGRNWVMYGLCQRKYRDRGLYIPGCPPEGPVTRDILREVAGLPALSPSSADFIREEEEIINPAGS